MRLVKPCRVRTLRSMAPATRLGHIKPRAVFRCINKFQARPDLPGWRGLKNLLKRRFAMGRQVILHQGYFMRFWIPFFCDSSHYFCPFYTAMVMGYYYWPLAR